MDKLKAWSDNLETELKEGSREYFKDLDFEKPKPKEDIIYQDIQKFFDIKTLAKQFIKVQPLHYNKYRIWWMWNWNKLKWEMIDETDILLKIEKAGKDRLTNMNLITPLHKSMIMEALKQEARKEKPLNTPKSWIQFNDSIIDINEDQIKRYVPSASYFMTNVIPFDIGVDSKTPVTDKIFKEWVGKDYVQTLYEIIGYCMLPDYPLHKIFCLVGAGMNGKSKFIELLTRIIGKDNVASTDLEILLNSRFEASKLYKKLVCIMGETNFSKMSKTAIIKRLTGQDLIGFEIKRKDPFNDYNYAKLIIATNSLPPTQDKTVGYYRRWVIIEFPNRFNEKKDILKDIPKQEYLYIARKCINCLKGLMKEREFFNEGSVEDKEKKYEDLSNPLEKFINEHIEESFDDYITKGEFREFFWGWQRQNGFRRWSDTQIGLALKSEYGWNDGQRFVDDGDQGGQKKERVWLGFK